MSFEPGGMDMVIQWHSPGDVSHAPWVLKGEGCEVCLLQGSGTEGAQRHTRCNLDSKLCLTRDLPPQPSLRIADRAFSLRSTTC